MRDAEVSGMADSLERIDDGGGYGVLEQATVDRPVDAALSGARGAVLWRLWGALGREGIVPGATVGDPFDPSPPDFAVAAAGREHRDPGGLARMLGLGEGFAAELDNSVANLALARAAQPAPDGGPPALTRAMGLAGYEQSIVDGHPLHPCCRTRLGMSEAEVRAYAPEHRPVVGVPVYAVPENRWYTVGGLPPRLPVHPWQAAHVLDAYPFLTPTGHEIATRPLMSLRTVAPVRDRDHHLKLALDVQMTSAVRIVSPAALHNGPAVSALLEALAVPGLAVLAETGTGGVLVDGAPCRSLSYVRRAAPALSPGEVAVPMAALAAPSPADGRPLAVEAVTTGYSGRPEPFLADLCRVLLPPLLALLHRGVALEAHGQNTLVVLHAGRPVRQLYRDMGGVRISPARLSRHGVTPPALHGDLATDDPTELRTKLHAALFATVLAEVVAVLRREFGAPGERLWAVVRERVGAVYAELPGDADARADAAALAAPTLPVKALVSMRLAADPIDDRWVAVPNPMAA